jgi:hypothetical protein
VLIGLPNIKSLRRAERKLEAANIPHYSWSEPDNDWGLTSIATAPLVGDQRRVLADYRIYSAPVAQNIERPTLNREDVGEIPTGSAKFMHAESEASD